MHVIFYSWQAQTPSNTNRGLIKNALDEAATALAADLAVEPRIDQDTQNVPGSPDIARTILKKIEKSNVFVADATITTAPGDRPSPNPNVLIELGYAMKALGEDRIILIMNEHYGTVETLPFDLRARRTITYNASPQAEKATERRRLASILITAIKAAIDTIPQTPPPPTDTDSAIAAIEAAAPNRSAAARRAMSSITKELEAHNPPLYRDNATTEQYLHAIEGTIPVVARFSSLTNTIASMNDAESARAIYRSLVPILQHYDNPKGWSGSFQASDFDYWKFLGHELLVTLIASLLAEERYEIITDLLNEPLTVNNTRYNEGKPVDFTYASEWLPSFEKLDQAHRKISYHGHLLNERHNGPLAETISLQQFADADYLLFLRGEISQNPWQEQGVPWRLPARNTTLHPQRRTKDRRGTTRKSTRRTRRPDTGKLARIWGHGYRQQPLTDEQVARIGTK